MILKRITNPKNTGIGITYPNDSQYHLYVLNEVVYPAGRGYNIRNWIKSIKSGTFEEKLYYDTNPVSSNLCFNGNISFSTWKYNGVYKNYKYSYDNLNRLLSSLYYDSNNVSSGANWESFQYDKQGNISYISRINNTGGVPLDILNLKYYGNQLKSVVDQYPPTNQYGAKEYIDRASSKEFSFDQNGNMTSDLDRNIVTIRYNVLNLPDTIQFSTGNQIINRYSADGRKLGTEYFTRVTNLAVPLITGEVIKQAYTINVINQNGTAYVDNKEYTTLNGNNVLTTINRLHNPEGYVYNLFKQYGAMYCYNRKDHLGNIREVWRATGYIPSATEQLTQYFPSGLPWATNPGDVSSAQPYKYNGKEFVEMHGYDTYDYGARGYYPASGRFMTVDPHAEKYYSVSPYAYCLGNPIRLIDIDGRDPGDFFRTKNGAANDWGKFYNGQSISKGQEYGSTIYRVTRNGKSGYTYTSAASGASDEVHVSPAPAGKKPVADIHSHGKYEEGYDNDKFSNRDKWDNYNKKIDGYLASPDGSLQKYDVNTAKTSMVNTNLPSDPNDPERKNDISPTNTQTPVPVAPEDVPTLLPIPAPTPVPTPTPIQPKQPWVLI